MIESVTVPKPPPHPVKRVTVVMLDGEKQTFSVVGIRHDGAAVELYGQTDLIAVFPLTAIRAVYEAKENEQQPNP